MEEPIEDELTNDDHPVETEPEPAAEDAVSSPIEEHTGPIAVRSSVYLQDLPRGQLAYVDPTDPYIVGLLAGGILVREEE